MRKGAWSAPSTLSEHRETRASESGGTPPVVLRTNEVHLDGFPPPFSVPADGVCRLRFALLCPGGDDDAETHQPPDQREVPLPPPARAQSGRLVSVGR